jgi:uncharacterized protein with HEPN domain
VTREFADFLDDMLDHARKAQGFVGGMSWEDFRADVRTQFASARAIEIVGEAARRIPDEVQERFPTIPWRQIIGMRNVLAHNYDGADPRIIFDTATLFLPTPIADLIAIGAEVDEES